MNKPTITIVLTLILIHIPIVRGAVIPALTLERGGWGGYTGGGGNRTHGWKFTVNDDLEVVALGIFDLEDSPMYAPGLLYSHEIGIWHWGELLYSTTIPAGTKGVLIDQFRYVEIPPISLTAGVTYVIGSTILGDPYVGNSSSDIVTLLPSITYKKTLTSPSGSGFSLPTEPRDYYCCGPNFLFVPKSAAIYYVATTGDNNNDGLSESTPFATIQRAIDAADHGDDIIVADGSYTGAGNRYIHFNGKAIALRSESGPDNCIIDCQGSEAEPSRAFKFHNDETAGSLLKGFTITGGYAITGGGIKCTDARPTIKNCIFSGNSAKYHGGGMSNYNSCPTLKDCMFVDNSSGDKGGGMLNMGSRPHLINCTFIANSAIYGGGILNGGGSGPAGISSTPTLINCLFINNSATSKGGGMYNVGGFSDRGWTFTRLFNCLFNANAADGSGGGVFNGGHLQLVNCIFSANSADWNGGGIFNVDYLWLVNCTFSSNYANSFGGGIHNKSSIGIVNCILWANEDSDGIGEAAQISGSVPLNTGPGPGQGFGIITNSCIQGWTRGGANTSDNPLFVNSAGYDNISGTKDDDLRLLPWSPCIDAGDNMYAWRGDELDGNPRVTNSTVDMGAYESLVPVEADVFIVPRVINRNNHLKRIIGIMPLPEGIEKKDLSGEPFLLYVGGPDVNPIRTIWQRVIGGSNTARVFALFDKADLMEVLPNSRRVELTVVGRLESGQYIYGSDTVRIVQPRRRRARGLRRR